MANAALEWNSHLLFGTTGILSSFHQEGRMLFTYINLLEQLEE